MITLYSINFQIGQIGNSKPFSIKRTVVRVSKKNHQFFQFEISLQQAGKQKEIYFAASRIIQTY